MIMKKNLTGFAVVIAAVMLAAFTTRTQPHNSSLKKDPAFHYYQLVSGAPSNPSNYVEITEEDYESLICSGSSTVCKIYAQEDPMNLGKPQFTLDTNEWPEVNEYVQSRELRN
jgi:hypothetical protein